MATTNEQLETPQTDLIGHDNKVHGANMGPTWVLSAPDGPHVGTMNLAIWEAMLPGAITGAAILLSFHLWYPWWRHQMETFSA